MREIKGQTPYGDDMGHKNYLEWINTGIIDELSPEEKNELDIHIADCYECKEAMNENERIFGVISNLKFKEPDESLLNDARLQLKAAIRIERNKPGFFETMKERLKDFFFEYNKLAYPGLAILLLGFFVGYLVFSSSNDGMYNGHFALVNSNNGAQTIQNGDVKITNVRITNSSQTDDEVEFEFDAIQSVKVKGNIGEEKIQKLLMHSIIDNKNVGTRLNSIYMLANEKTAALDKDIKAAVSTVVRSDENSGVRLEALKVLARFPFDETMKQTLLHVLMYDSNSGMRISAINILLESVKSGHALDENALSLFREKFSNDDNQYVRLKAQSVLEEKTNYDY